MLAIKEVYKPQFHRAERFSPQELFGIAALTVKFNAHEGNVIDMSDSGLCARIAPSSFAIHEKINLTLLNGDIPLLEVGAKITRINIQQNTVAVSFLQKVNCDALRLKNDLYGLMTRQEQEVPMIYKQFCSDMVFFLRQAKQLCAKNFRYDEAFDPHTEREIVYSLRRFLMPLWCDFMQRGNSIIDSHKDNSAILKAIKDYTELMITPEFMGAHGWERSFLQPRGYPGDYGVMEFIYEPEPFGHTFYDKLLHAFGQELGAFVRHRMQYAAQAIHDVVAAKGQHSPVHITSFGSGSAREISLFLATYDGDAAITFHLMDQDDKALRYAERHLRPKMLTHKNVSIFYHHLSIPESIAVLRRLPKQHFIYCLGVFDYLNTTQAQRFVSKFYDALTDDGLMLLANLSDIPTRPEWIFTNVFNWPMIYRSPQDMLKLTEGFTFKQTDLRYDATRFVHLLTLQR